MGSPAVPKLVPHSSVEIIDLAYYDLRKIYLQCGAPGAPKIAFSCLVSGLTMVYVDVSMCNGVYTPTYRTRGHHLKMWHKTMTFHGNLLGI